jgi:hypothetical protein
MEIEFKLTMTYGHAHLPIWTTVTMLQASRLLFPYKPGQHR